MALVCNVAWADFTLSYNQDTNFWGDVITEYPSGVSQVITDASITNAEVHCLSEYVKVKADGEVSVKFLHVNGQGSHCQHIVGVVLKNADGEIADYHHGKAGETPDQNTYTLSEVKAGDYTLNFYVTRNGSDLVNKYGGTITVTGAVRRVVGSDAENKIFYHIKNVRSGKYANYEGAGVQFTQVTTPTLGSYWYLMEVADAQGVPEGYKAYRIYNAANALAVENPGSGNMTANEGVQLPAKVYCIGEHTKGGTTGVVIRCLNEDAASWNDAEGSGTKIANHTYDAPGSIWEFEKANIAESQLIQNAVAVKTGVLNTLATEVTNTQRYHYGYALSDIEAKKAEIEAISVSQTSLVDALTTAITLSKMTPLAELERIAPKAGDKFTMVNKGRNSGKDGLVAFAAGTYVKCLQSPFPYFDALWTLVATETEGQFKLYNEKLNVYVGVLSDAKDTKFQYVSEAEEAGVYELANVEGYATFKKVGGDNNSHLHQSNWGGKEIVRWDNGDCSQWRLVKPFGPELTTDANNPICYALKSGRDGNYYFTLDNNKVKLFNNKAVATDETTHWYFMLDESGNLKMYSKSDNKAMGYLEGTDGATKLTNDPATADYDSDTYTLYFAPYNQTNYNGAWFALKPSRGDTYVSNHGGTSNYMGFYDNFNDGGTRIAFESIITYTLTDKVGNRYTGTYSGTVGETTPTFTGLEYTLTNEEWNGNNFTATIEFSNLPFPVSSASVTNATMISSFKDGGGSYPGAGRFKWYAEVDDVKIQRDASTMTREHLWAIYPSLENGALVYSIKNIATGKYIFTNATFGNSDGNNNKGTVILSDTPTKFSVDNNNSLYYYTNGRNHFLSWGSVNDASGYLGVHTKTVSAGHNGITNSFHESNYTLSDKGKFVNGDVYTFVTSLGWMGATAESSNVISTARTNVAAEDKSADNPYFQWTVYKSNNGNYYLYNIGKKMFMGVQSTGNASVPFTENPAGKMLTFKEGNKTGYPILFSTDNKGSVNHSTDFGEGLITWSGGWNELTDNGNSHKVTLVSQLPAATLQEIAKKVEAYDKRLYVKTEVEGLPDGNPNTHYGSVIATNASTSFYRVLKKVNSNIAYLDYDGLKETTISFGREYRGFEFQGFKLGEQDLGKSITLAEDQKASITAETPLVAKVKFNGTKDVTLFSDDDEFSYRIPAITTTGTGRIIAVSDYRHNLDDIGRDNHHTGTLRIDLVMRYSDNKGATWSEKQTIAAGSGNKADDGYDCAYGDAAIAAVGEKVLVMAAAGNVVFTGGSATSHNRTVRLFSEDNGTTWTKEDISKTLFIGDAATIKNGYSAFFGSGKLAVDTKFIGTPEKPRIYGAMLIRKSNGTSTSNYNNYAIYSDDFGRTWHILGSDDDSKQTPIASGDEPKVEILPNGQILLSVRRSGGRIFNVFTYGSNDGDKANGIGTWNGNENFNNGGADCNGETFCVDATKPDGTKTKLLLQSQPKGGDRTKVSIWYKEISAAADATHTSADIAGNWTFGLQVSTQKSAYSAMTLQKDGKIGFFFEEAPCFGDDHTKGYCMVYIPLSIEEITGCSYYSANVDPTASTTVNISLSDAQGNVYEFTKTSALNAIATTLTTDYPFITLGNEGNIDFDGTNYTYTNTVTLPFKVSNEENTYWHNIYFHTNGENELVYLYANSADDSYVVKANGTANHPYGESQYNTLEKADNMSWAMYHVGNFTFRFKNKLTDKYVRVKGVVSSGNEQNVEYVNDVDAATAFSIEVDARNSWKGDYSLKATGTYIGYLSNTSTSVDYATNYSTNGHQGGWATFKEAPDFETLIAEVNAVLNMFGDGLGQYSGVSEEDLADAKVEMETPNDLNLKVLNDYKALSTEAELNLPQSGQFFRVAYDYGNAGKLYMQSTASTVKGLQFAAETGAASIWVYYDGALYSYAAGQCLREHGDDRGLQAVGGKTTATFSASTRAKGKYNIVCGSYVHANSSNGSYYTDHCSGNNCAQHDLILEEVTSLPFTFNSKALGFATFNAPVAVQLPTGVIAYVAQIVDNSTLKMRKFISENGELVVIPANTPVMLYKEKLTADTQISLDIEEDPYSKEELAEIKKKNGFSGTIAAEIYPAGYTVYSLQKKSGEDMVGFYQKARETTLGSFKAWIKIPNPNSPQAFAIFFDGDDATGLKEALGIENENVEIYDLSGRRLDKPVKGVNVIGGKLVIK